MKTFKQYMIEGEKLPIEDLIDPKGWGSTPNVVDRDYFGHTVHMTPSEFSSYTSDPAHDFKKRVEDQKQNILSGGKVAHPFLKVSVDYDGSGDEDGKYHVTGHEGRARMGAIKELYGDVKVPVVIFGQPGVRARHFTPEIIDKLSRGFHKEKFDR